MNKQELISTLNTECEYQRLNSRWTIARGIEIALNYVEELDEPETLSPEWIGKNTFVVTDTDGDDYVVVENRKLRDLLVPKQEKMVVPSFVDEWIREYKEDSNLILALSDVYEEYTKNQNRADKYRNMYLWLEKGENEEVLARAWLDGYEVEEEPKYYVKNAHGYMVLKRNIEVDSIFSTGGESKSVYKEELEAYKLTEEEIKAYDERYWVFAVPVEQEDEE